MWVALALAPTVSQLYAHTASKKPPPTFDVFAATHDILRIQLLTQAIANALSVAIELLYVMAIIN